MKTARLASLLLLACFAAPALCLAQDGAEEIHDEEARGLFLAGEAAFAGGRFKEALGYFQRSYELSQRTALLYNIGQAADRARHDEVALDAFRRYLEASPEVSNRVEIEGRIRVLEAAIAEGEAEREPIEPVVEPPSDPVVTAAPVAPAVAPSSGPDVAGIVLTAAGGALAIPAIIMIALGVPDIGAMNRERNQQGIGLTAAGTVLLVASLVGVTVGIILLATSGGSPPEEASVRASPDGLLVAF